jgi:CheY-like chemotaxis protein
MDGYELARRLRADPATRDVKLIALTGYGLAEDERRAQAAGFDVHFTKPVDPETFLKTLAEPVQRRAWEAVTTAGS